MQCLRAFLSARPFLLTVLVLSLAACGRESSSSARSSTSSQAAAPPGAVEIIFTYGSEKKAWVEAVTPGFNQSGVKTGAGHAVFVTAVPMGSGDCVDEVLNGARKPHVISPASAVFLKLGNARSQAASGQPLVKEAVNLVLSPVVIAMWQPMAEKLGWPQKALGWADIHALAADPNGWATLGAPQWGQFRFGHTHPDYSNSGLLSIIAEVAAASGKVRGLTVEDAQRPATADYVRQIEQAMVHYGESTGFFGQAMFSGGPEYLSAAVLYENMVIESRSKSAAEAPVSPVVAIYPKEGTFWSDHPAAVVNRPWVTAEHEEAARKYLDFLMDVPQQLRALEAGFRPGNPSVAVGAPVDAAHGVDAAQPQTLLEVPDSTVVESIRQMWAKNKKAAAVTLVLDCSGSMREENKMAFAREGAKQFIGKLGDGDRLSILAFNNKLAWLADDQPVGEKRAELQKIVDGLLPNGGTSLHDAVAEAAQRVKQKGDLSRIAAIVVLSDGADEGSRRSLDQVLGEVTSGGEQKGVRIFSIAYGSGARLDVLEQISKTARGRAFRGDTKNIDRVFRDISIFF